MSRTIYWAGRQWCVTDFGMDTLDGRYDIAAGSLGTLTEGAGRPMAERVRHVCEKTWVDCEDFFAAFAIACQIHTGKFEPLPADALLNAMELVRLHEAENVEFQRLKKERFGDNALLNAESFDLSEEADAIVAARGASYRTLPDPLAPAERG